MKSILFFPLPPRRRPDWRWTEHPDHALVWAVFGCVWGIVGVLIGFLLVTAITGCASPAILGGPTAETTRHPCDTGGSCPNGYDCPPLANPTGPCELSLGLAPMQWARRREDDAGRE